MVAQGAMMDTRFTFKAFAYAASEKDSEIHDIISRHRRAQTKDAEGKMGSFGICG
jgi:hypothetical protein